MIDVLSKEIGVLHTREEKVNRLRELIQILILKICADGGFFAYIVFTGGTALRILYDLRRFSEDLDFSLVHREGYDFSRFSSVLNNRLLQYGLQAETKGHTEKTVQKMDVRMKKILFDLGLSPLRNEKLFIRVEIDTNPPAGGKTELSLVNKMFVFQIAHFDLPSLFAGKLCACFFRKYTKGRDFYDLLWYLTKKVEPNYELLNNTIRQAHGGKINSITDRPGLRAFLQQHLEKIDFDKVRRDVERFLENKDEADLLTRENFLNLTRKFLQ